MAIVTNKDIETLIKMENLIGINEKLLFGENKDKEVVLEWFSGEKTTITREDFNDFINVIERLINTKKEIAKKQNEINKKNVEYHRITNKIWYARKTNNIKNLEKYQKELEDYKKRQNKI